MRTVPDKCPFCESPIMVHVGNLLVSEDGAFATYKCRTIQDIMWSDDQWKRTGQSDGCRKREVQLLTKRLDEARERIKRLEEAGDKMDETAEPFVLDTIDEDIPMSDVGEQYEIIYDSPPTAGDHVAMDRARKDWRKAKEAKP